MRTKESNVESGREKRIKQLQACDAGIYEEAEQVVGGLKYNQGLKVMIDFPCNGIPTVTVERTFIPEKLLEHICNDTDQTL